MTSQTSDAGDQYERCRARVDTLERYLLGGCIMDRSGHFAAETTVAFREEWLRSTLHRAVFRAVKALVGRGCSDLDVGLVIAELQSQGTFEQFTNAISCICLLTEGVVAPPSRQSRLFRLEEMRRAWRDLDQTRQGADDER